MTIKALEESLKAEKGIEAATLATGTATGTAVDTKNFDEAFIILDAGTATATGTLDVTVEEGDTSGGSFTAIAGALFVQIVAANDNRILVGRIRVKNFKRFIRIVAVVATDTVDASVIILLGKFDGLAKVLQTVEPVSFAIDFVQDGGTDPLL